jgi:hypothetical protein
MSLEKGHKRRVLSLVAGSKAASVGWFIDSPRPLLCYPRYHGNPALRDHPNIPKSCRFRFGRSWVATPICFEPCHCRGIESACEQQGNERPTQGRVRTLGGRCGECRFFMPKLQIRNRGFLDFMSSLWTRTEERPPKVPRIADCY